MENRELNLADLLGIALKRIWVIIAAMIMMSKVKDPVSALMALDGAGKRKFF